MDLKVLLDLTVKGVVSPTVLWEEKLQETKNWIEVLKFPVLVFVVIIAVVSAVIISLFGYQIPFMGVIHPTMSDIIMQSIGTVVSYSIAIVIMSWVAAYIAKTTEGTDDQSRAIWMLFLVSIPSLLGQVLATLPSVGMLIAMGLGIYSIVLFYKAIPVFMEVPLKNRVRYFIFVTITSIIVSVSINLTIGKVFQPTVPEATSMEIPGFVLEQ